MNKKISYEDLLQRVSELAHIEKKSRIWIESLPVCTKIVDIDYKLQYMSHAGIKSLNIDDVTKFYGTPYPLDFFPESFKKSMSARLDKAKATGKTTTHEAAVIDSEGKELWFFSTIIPVNNDDCQFDYFIVVSDDITKRKHVEKKLQSSEKHFRELFEGNKSVGLIMDIDNGDILEVNRAAEIFYGYTREQLLSLNISDINTLSKKQIKVEMALAETENRNYFLFQHQLANKMITDVEVHSGPIHWNEKKVLYSIVRDISERKLTENALAISQKNLQRALEGTIAVITKAVEARDPYTAGHQKQVANLAYYIAKEMGLDEEQVKGISLAASIHDIGKIQVPAEILSKPSALTHIEYQLIQVHSEAGYNILKDIEFPWPIADVAYQHHERMDGTGYPLGIKGNEICIEARIVAVADVVEAMYSHRPYRPGLGLDAALEEIKKHKGTRYDIAVVDACIELFKNNQFCFNN